MNVIFLGAPGAGKGTLAEPIKEKFNLEHFSTGDMLRKERASGSEVGKLADYYMTNGLLVPDEVIIKIVEKKIGECEGGLLFDGFPRTVEQADALAKIAKVDAVIYLDAPLDEIIARVCSRRNCPACGKIFNTRTYSENTCDVCGAELVQRADDTEETVRKRYEVYEQSTAPLVDYYKEQGLVHVIISGDLNENVAEASEILAKL